MKMYYTLLKTVCLRLFINSKKIKPGFVIPAKCTELIALIFIFHFLFSGNLTAQSSDEKGLPFVTNYTPKILLATTQAWSAIEDNKGLMYFGIGGGLYQYDAINWYKIPMKSNSNIAIRAVAKDAQGRIFYGADGDFGYLMEDSLGQMQIHSLLPNVPQSLRDFSNVWTIYTTNQQVYFQSRERIFRFTESRNNTAEKWQVQTWNPQTKFMYAFYLDGNYYVHQSGLGLYKLINDSLQLIPGSEFLGKDRMQVMLPYPESNNNEKQYLAGTFYSGLYIYNGKTFRPFVTEADSIFKASTLYKAVQLKDGSYALATTGKGVIIINAQGKMLGQINKNTGIKDESVYGIYQDSRGNLWLATENSMSKVDISSPFTQFSAQSGITTTSQCAIRFEGSLYLGSANGLLKFNSKKKQFELINGIPASQIFALLKDSDRLIVPGNGLFFIKNNKINLVRASVGGNLQLSASYISPRYPDLLFCGSTFGALIFARKMLNTSSGNWQFIGNVPNIDNQIWSFSEDRNGRIWAGSSDNVYRITLVFDKKGNIDLQKILVDKFGAEQGLESGSAFIYNIKGENYFPTDSALYRYNEKENRFYTDTAFGNSKNNGADILQQDYAGRVWIQKGGAEMQLATPLPNGTYHIDKTPFLPLYGKSINQFYPEKNGIVWICTTDGLIRYDEKLKQNYDAPYNTLLRSVKAGAAYLNPDINDKRDLQIAYKNNALRFEYAAPFFDQEDKTKYQTWLEGFDKTWSNWDGNSYKEYTNLPAGKYTFHVHALNIYDKVSNEAAYVFTIQPPWYRTLWAYAVYILVLIACVWLLIAYRSRKLSRQNRILEEKVTHRTAQLNKSLAELKSTQSQLIQSEKMASLGELTAGIAHEIQNPLNFVNNFSEVNTELIEELKTERLKPKAEQDELLQDEILNDLKINEEKINHHGKRADGIVKGMLQHSRKNTGIKEQTDINALADEYLRLSYYGLKAKDKSFNADFKTDFDEILSAGEAGIGKINIVPQDIGRVLLNLFNNAFYAVNEKLTTHRSPLTDGYKPLVSVQTKKLNDKIEIKVTDNGNGIPQQIIDKIFQPFFTTKPTGEGTGLGLSISYDIITKEHKGIIKVESKEGEGSQFIIHLPV